MILTHWRAVVSCGELASWMGVRSQVGRCLAIACVALAFAAGQPLAAQLGGDALQPQIDSGRRFYVYHLRHISAELASQCLGTTLVQQLPPEFRLQADMRTNSLIVYANEEEIKVLARDLEALDGSMPNPEDAVRDLATATLSFTLIVERTTDERLGKLERLAERQVEALDAINRDVPGSSFQDPVVAVHLATPVSPRQLSEAAVGAKQQPLSLIAQMNSGRFELQGAGPGRCCGLRIEGSLVKQGTQYLLLAETHLDMEFPAVAADKPPKHEVAKLSTEVVMTPGVPILLSLSSLDGKKCLLMVELIKK